MDIEDGVGYVEQARSDGAGGSGLCREDAVSSPSVGALALATMSRYRGMGNPRRCAATPW